MIPENAKLVISIIHGLFQSLLALPFIFIDKDWFFPRALKCDEASVARRLRKHNEKIHEVAASIRHARSLSAKVVIKRTPGQGHSARSPAYKVGHYAVDISRLTSILEIDPAEQWANVETLVTFEDLCRQTLEYSLLPIVVPEFKSITIGGAIQGIGIESTSWKHGAFDRSVLEATLITGYGEIVKSSNVVDLWHELPGSNGTLGIVVCARIRLAPATKWIRLRYVHYTDDQSFPDDVTERIKLDRYDANCDWRVKEGQEDEGVRMIDAVRFRKKGIVAMYGSCVSGTLQSHTVYRESVFSPFFYQHISSVLSHSIRMNHSDLPLSDKKRKKVIHEEYMPTMQYLFRYDRGGFWGIEALGYIIPPIQYALKSKILLGFINHFLTTATLYKIAMLVSDQKRESIAMLQDVDIPSDQTCSILEWADQRGFEMLWLCPVASHAEEGIFSVSSSHGSFVVNVGLYGSCVGLPRSNLELQRLVARAGGKVALYAFIYASQKEFWSWYDVSKYEALRTRYGGDVFLGLWEKVCVQNSTL